MAGIAESAASSVISSVIDKLFAESVGAISSISGVRKRVEEIKRELEVIQSNLIKADALQARDKNENRQIWMSTMEDVAFQLENIIITFNFEEKLRKERCFFKGCVFLPKRWTHLYKISKNIQLLQPNLKKIEEQGKEYLNNNSGEGQGSGSSSEPMRWVLPDAEEDYVIGLEGTTESLVSKLLQYEDDDERQVVSITGMPGLGKTTLAKRAYNCVRNDIKSHFDCYAWADVSQECNVTKVLTDVGRRLGMEEAKGMSEADNETQLLEELNEFLKDKRYLVVLDDVWNEKDWDRLKLAFPGKGKKGSKILLTSRSEDVARYADPRCKPIVPPFLTEEESWKLFCKKAFGEPNCPSEQLEKCGRDMVRECGGLPLAIVVLGGIMSKKSSLREWEMVQRNVNWQLGKGERLSSIIGLSYNELSYHLKSCFLYFSLFPEDHRIKSSPLFRLWIAEGFICRNGNETLEEAAENCLKELISRGMVQIAEMSDTTQGKVEVCHMHDVLRDFSIEKAKNAKFGRSFFFAPDSSSSSSSSSEVEYPSCRVAIHAPGEISYDVIRSFIANNQCHRSVLFFGAGFTGTGLTTIKFSSSLKFLRILDLATGFEFGGISLEIGKLIHLRYLKLDVKVFFGQISLPSSVGNLQMLQTLDLDSYSLDGWKIPDVLWKMKELRYVSFSSKTPTKHLCFDNLINLHTLKGVEAGRWMTSNGKFANLVKLEIAAKKEKVGDVCDFAAKLPSLQSLRLTVLKKSGGEQENSRFQLAPLDKCDKLVKLRIAVEFWGKLWLEALAIPKSNKENQQFPPHLTTLELERTTLREDPMPILEKLPNLLNLRLEELAYTGRSVVCKAQGFPRLQHLLLELLYGLEEWRIEEGAMPNLRRLHFYFCWSLKLVPEGLRFLTTLEEIKLSAMPSSFCNSTQDIIFCSQVQHIPSIKIQTVPSELMEMHLRKHSECLEIYS